MERAKLDRRLTCEECGVLVSEERADGWQARLAGGVVDGYDIGELEVGVYCPGRAEESSGADDSSDGGKALDLVQRHARRAPPA